MIDIVTTTIPATTKRPSITFVSGFTTRPAPIDPSAMKELNVAAGIPGAIGKRAKVELAKLAKGRAVKSFKGRTFILALQGLHPTFALDRAERSYLLSAMRLTESASGLTREDALKLAA